MFLKFGQEYIWFNNGMHTSTIPKEKRNSTVSYRIF